MKHITTTITTLLVAATLFSSSVSATLAQTAPKKPAQKPPKAAEVKYKAHCGMIYSAADAKKYHYICPMDHKPLVKMKSGKAGTNSPKKK